MKDNNDYMNYQGKFPLPQRIKNNIKNAKASTLNEKLLLRVTGTIFIDYLGFKVE